MQGLAGLGARLFGAGGRMLKGGWQNLKRMFGLGGAATGGGLLANALNGQQNQQGQDGEEEQQLNIEEPEVSPNVTPIQQLNMGASGVISPMVSGGTPDEKLDYIVSSVDSMRRTISTLVSSIRSLAIGQATVNRNVAATAERPQRQGFIRTTVGGALKAAGLGTALALGIGAAAGLLSNNVEDVENIDATLENITPSIAEIKSGQVKPEESNLYKTAESLVTRFDQSYGLPVSLETPIEKAMEENENIKTFVEGLRSNGVEVDPNATLYSLPEIVKSIAPATTQEPGQPATPPAPGTEQPQPEASTPPAATPNITPQPGQEETTLENSTAAPTTIAPPASSPANEDATIEQPIEGETQEDEMRGIEQQSSLRDTLQEPGAGNILPSTQSIRDRSFETATNTKTVVAPVVINGPQAPAQQVMPQVASDGRGRGATLTVAYKTPADSRTYSQDNFASV